jgi:glutamate-1-semialdehyde 2,1-aminomutase
MGQTTAGQVRRALRARADKVLVSGVSRGFNNLPEFGPFYFTSGSGPYLEDVDGNQFIDYVMGWGSLLLGHNPPVIREALGRALDGAYLYQHETPAHIELAELVQRSVPCAERVRFTGSGLEATLFAIRLARARTGRQKILKMEGHFHGLHDYLVYSTGSTPLGQQRPDGTIEPVVGSAGAPEAIDDFVVVVPFNDLDALESAIAAHGPELAAVLLEPIALNMGCVRPDPGYLQRLREVTRDAGILLIFDEVLTGFRVALGGAQELYGVQPDLACFSEAFGAGMPIAALTGRAEVMELLGPPGPVPMSGTNSARALSVVGALASLRELRTPGFHVRLGELNDRLVHGLRRATADAGVPAFVDGCGGRIGLYFGLDRAPRNLRDIAGAWNVEYHTRVYRRLVSEEALYGFNPLGNAPDALNVTIAHSEKDLDETIDRFARVVGSEPYREPAA